LATSTWQAKAKPREAQNVEPARDQDFERCNNCKQAFALLDGRIDMAQFRMHKAECRYHPKKRGEGPLSSLPSVTTSNKEVS